METTSKRSIIKATLISLSVALVLLFIIVIPAEYGIDLLGTGKLLGLNSMAATKIAVKETTDNKTQTKMFQLNTVELKLFPRQGYEYKFRLEEGSAMLYSWTSNKAIEYEFHGEPEIGPKGYFKTYEKQKSALFEQGSFTAPFTGRQGWYFKNNSGESVAITLNTAGYYEVIGILSTSTVTKN